MSALYATAIYGLIDPRTNELRYVGKTIQPLTDRMRTHLSDAQKIRRRHVCTWIRSLQREGVEPEIFEIDRVGDDWAEQEQFWIAYFRYIGCNLTNQTIGGEGTLGRKTTAASRARMSEAQQRAQTPEFRARKSEIAKRFHADPGIQARITEGIRESCKRPDVKARRDAARIRPDVMAKRVASIKATFDAEPERLKRRGDAIKAGKLKPENRIKAAESQRRRHIEKPFSVETRAKLSRAFKARIFSDETRERMSIAAKNRRVREKADADRNQITAIR